MANYDSISHLAYRIIRNDEKAFNEVMDRYSAKLFAYSMKFTKSREWSQELVQDVFVKLWTYRKSIKEYDTFEAYLFTIARHICFDHLKKIALEENLKKELIENYSRIYLSSGDEYKLEQYEQLAFRAVKGLPPKRQVIYRLSKEEKLTYDQIALQLGISKNTVKEQIAQASKSIKEYFRIHGDLVLFIIPSLFSYLVNF